MSETVQEFCDKCKKAMEIFVKDFQAAMKAEEPILCPDCQVEYIDENTEEIPKRRFEYVAMAISIKEFNDAGRDGWELVTVNNTVAYFKREIYGVIE